MTGDPARNPEARQITLAANEADDALSPAAPVFADVLAAAQTGAHWAMTALFRHFNPALMRYLKMADPCSYDDLVAEVWTSVLGAVGGFHGEEDDFRAWLYTIARNRLIDLRRRAARHPVAPVPDDQLISTHVQADPGEELTDRLHAQRAVKRMMSRLPDSQSRVVVLRVVDGFDVADVARIMGRSPGWVRVTQHRALIRLGQLMGGRRWDADP
jgi:RNA polymerase sigma-70 factor, ECF subfamily